MPPLVSSEVWRQQVERVDGEREAALFGVQAARVRPELLPAMYPDLERWREVQRTADPEGLMRSDLARRLGLVGG